MATTVYTTNIQPLSLVIGSFLLTRPLTLGFINGKLPLTSDVYLSYTSNSLINIIDTGTMVSMKFINPQALSSTLALVMCYRPSGYKFHRHLPASNCFILYYYFICHLHDSSSVSPDERSEKMLKC